MSTLWRERYVVMAQARGMAYLILNLKDLDVPYAICIGSFPMVIRICRYFTASTQLDRTEKFLSMHGKVLRLFLYSVCQSRIFYFFNVWEDVRFLPSHCWIQVFQPSSVALAIFNPSPDVTEKQWMVENIKNLEESEEPARFVWVPEPSGKTL